MYKALIIDDEAPVRKAILALGRWSAYHIETPLTATNGREALKTMWEVRPDIVFVDMQMPVMNGIEFLKQASLDFPKSKYIVISGFDTFQYAQSALKNGAIDYLLKPVIADDLDGAIRKAVTLLNGDRGISEPAAESSTTVSIDEVIEIIKSYVDKNYCAEIKIAMFADKYFFSKEYLSKAFKRKYDYGIYEYALKLRMERAVELLADDTITIKDISDRLGYSNNNYFSKAFKTYYDISPSEYRERNI